MGISTKIKLLQKEGLKKDVLKFTCLAPEIAELALPGQFIEVKVTSTYEPFLKRPISIYNVDKENKTIEFIFQIRGRGTEFLSKAEVGDMLEVLAPLGDGTFDIKKCKNIAIIGGGIGIFPLYELAKHCKDAKVNIYLGFRSKDFVMLEDEFKVVSDNLLVTTDDGTYEKKGFSINYLKEDFEKQNFDGIFACGPLPMLRSVKEFAESKNVYCQISLEEIMGCGIGACLGCAVKYKSETEETYKRVCKEVPVFNARNVEI